MDKSISKELFKHELLYILKSHPLKSCSKRFLKLIFLILRVAFAHSLYNYMHSKCINFKCRKILK